MEQIRNFAIIAHIDHGKSTLADRLIELTGLVEPGRHEEQMLDANPISRERGITIKLAPVVMRYHYVGTDYILNLIDTPGHVDFAYEVDRTLSCVEGAILLVDATQGIQAQTISNAYKALEKNLTIIPVVNKIDLPSAKTSEVMQELVEFLGCKREEIICISAKTGQNVQEVIHAILHRVPPPHKNIDGNQSLIFDSYFDTHRGVIAFVRVFNGSLRAFEQVTLCHTGVSFEVAEVGIFTPHLTKKDVLNSGEIGYMVTNLKDIHDVRVGDTITLAKTPSSPLAGYKAVKPMVFASLFTTDTKEYENLKKALEKLALNDSALQFSPLYSKALGAGFRVGFLGLLHADVVRERLEREYNLDLVITPPTVEFLQDQEGNYLEPITKILIITPQEYVGAVMRLTENYRGVFKHMDNKNQTTLIYELPMSELISDYFDHLKSVTSGYASLDWELVRHEVVSADKLEILINGEPIEEFSEIVVKERSYEKAQELCSKLKELIPRQQFEVKIQARYKGKIIASSSLSAYRKDVLMKHGKVLGSGDVGRKKKLLEKQKEGKKRMKMIGKVEVPKEAFLKLFKKG